MPAEDLSAAAGSAPRDMPAAAGSAPSDMPAAAGSAPSDPADDGGAPPRALLTHAGLYVTDLEAMVTFYTALLGLVVTDRGEHLGRELAFLSRDPSEHHQLVFVTGRRAPADVQLLSQLSFRLDDDDLVSLRWFARRAVELGVRDLEGRNHGNSWSIYFSDPERNRLELYTATPWYVRQPWRVPLDLGETDEAIREGTKRLIEQTGVAWSPVEAWRASVASQMALRKQLPADQEAQPGRAPGASASA